MRIKVLIIQPLIPHYRLNYFNKLYENPQIELKIVYARQDNSLNQLIDLIYLNEIKKINLRKIEFFFVKKTIIDFMPDVIICYGEIKQLTNYWLYFRRKKYNYKLFIWTQGSNKKKDTIIDKTRFSLLKYVDGVLFYTQKCLETGKKYGIKKMTALNNTLYFEKNNINYDRNFINKLKEKYGITTSINGIFISRFTKIKAPKLILELMQAIHLKNKNIGFVVIGKGKQKPNFSNYSYIYDFGEVYSQEKKNELMALANFAIMPRWVGLSVVDVFAHQLPMITLSNQLKDIEHSVEFSYIEHNTNGYIAKSKQDFIDFICSSSLSNFKRMGENAYNYACKKLSFNNMVQTTIDFISEYH